MQFKKSDVLKCNFMRRFQVSLEPKRHECMHFEKHCGKNSVAWWLKNFRNFQENFPGKFVGIFSRTINSWDNAISWLRKKHPTLRHDENEAACNTQWEEDSNNLHQIPALLRYCHIFCKLVINGEMKNSSLAFSKRIYETRDYQLRYAGTSSK